MFTLFLLNQSQRRVQREDARQEAKRQRRGRELWGQLGGGAGRRGQRQDRRTGLEPAPIQGHLRQLLPQDGRHV